MIPETSARQAIALAGQGANVSEIARQLGHDRKTIRIYLNGHRAPGQPRPHADSFAPFAAYVRQRAGDDRHLRSTGLHREITALGYAGSYSAFTRELRGHGITAACGTCRKWKPILPRRRESSGPGRSRSAPPRSAARRSPPTCRAPRPPATCRPAPSPLPPALVRRPGRRLRRHRQTGLPQPADIRRLAALTGISRNRAAARAPRTRPLSVRLA